MRPSGRRAATTEMRHPRPGPPLTLPHLCPQALRLCTLPPSHLSLWSITPHLIQLSVDRRAHTRGDASTSSAATPDIDTQSPASALRPEDTYTVAPGWRPRKTPPRKARRALERATPTAMPVNKQSSLRAHAPRNSAAAHVTVSSPVAQPRACISRALWT